MLDKEATAALWLSIFIVAHGATRQKGLFEAPNERREYEESMLKTLGVDPTTLGAIRKAFPQQETTGKGLPEGAFTDPASIELLMKLCERGPINRLA